MAGVQALTELADEAAANEDWVSPPVSDDQVAISLLDSWMAGVLSSHRIPGDWDLDDIRTDLKVSSHLEVLFERVGEVVVQEQRRLPTRRRVARFSGVSTVPGQGVQAGIGPYEFFTSDDVHVFLHDTHFLGIRQEHGSAEFYFQFDPQWVPEGADGTAVVVLTFDEVTMERARLHEGPASGSTRQVDSFEWDGSGGFALDTGRMRLAFTAARMSAQLVGEPPDSLHHPHENS